MRLSETSRYLWRKTTVLGDIGDIYRLLNEDHKALQYLEEAILAAHDANHFKASCSYLTRMAWIYRKRKQYDDALESLDQAVLLSKERGFLLEYAESLAAIGNIYLLKGNHLRAKSFLTQARDLGEDLPHIKVLADCLKDLGIVNAIMKNSSVAHSCLYQAQDVAKQADFPEVVYLTHIAHGQLYEEEGNIEQAIHEYQNAIGVIESIRQVIRFDESKTGYLIDKVDSYQALILLFCSNGRFARALSVLEQMKSRAFLDLLAVTTVYASSTVPLYLIDREGIFISQIRDIIRDESRIVEMEIELRGIEEDLYSLWEEISRYDHQYVSLRRANPVSIADIQQSITITS